MSLIREDRYKFWTEDPTILFKNGNYTKILPKNTDSRVEQLNAITRLIIYLTIILYSIGVLNEKNIYYPLIILVFLVLFFYVYEYDVAGKRKELIRNKTKEGMSNINESNESIVLESGVYDSNGDLRVGKFYSHEPPNNAGLDYTMEEYLAHKNATCRIPTENNPFMNPTADEFNNGEIPKACNIDDEDLPDIKTKQQDFFNKDLYRDMSDLYDVKNSQRQFYTIPHGYPNDQQAFAEWLYKTPETCKENNANCLRYEDLRYKSQL